MEPDRQHELGHISKDFVTAYYNTINENDFSHVLDFFSENCIITVNSEHYRNAYENLVKMSQSGIKSFNYLDYTYAFQQIENSMDLLISVGGHFKMVSFDGSVSRDDKIFMETFILKRNIRSKYGYQIINYVLLF